MPGLSDWLEYLTGLYGKNAAGKLKVKLQRIVDYYRHIPKRYNEISGQDAMLITYGDQISEPGIPALRTLNEFCGVYLKGLISCMHILPFYPFSSDDGFSVIDYRGVNPGLGGWKEIKKLSLNFRLMFDAVINHVSSQSKWFSSFLNGKPEYKDYFITVEGEPDLSRTVRPRTTPLLTRFGEKKVWTTFSPDQIDLNYNNPQVLLEMIGLILFYIGRGSEFIRLDAIAYLWKEAGTSCIHLPKTHSIIQLLRSVLDKAAPYVKIITETNVAHRENLSYFGDGSNEAHLVYNFALPPLILHTFLTGNAKVLTKWAAGLKMPSRQTAFFNFLASHDGIGLNPVRGILTETEIGELVKQTLNHGGFISYKTNPDGSKTPYELNINYFDALSGLKSGEAPDKQIDRFIAAHAIMLSLAGLPGIYFHSLFGSRGWTEGVKLTGQNRSVNRQKLGRIQLEEELSDKTSLRYRVFLRLSKLLQARSSSTAFNPYGEQIIEDYGDSVFALLRMSASGDNSVLCIQNVSDVEHVLNIDIKSIMRISSGKGQLYDLITGSRFDPEKKIIMEPYRTLWLTGISISSLTWV